MNDKQQLQALGESMSESIKPYTREEAINFLATKVTSWPVSSTDGVYYPPEWHRADTAVTCPGWRWVEDSTVWFARDDRSDAISAYEWKMTQAAFEPFVSVEDAQPEGRKLDGGKVIMGAIPPDAELAVARVLTFGAEKYARDNWRKVPDMGVRYMDAALRHLNAHRRGELADHESGESHLAHAACCILFMLQIEEESK